MAQIMYKRIYILNREPFYIGMVRFTQRSKSATYS